ncbi:hypothetical protein ONZ45_g8554 [Pleurotus djamor]|nr:hypothetical protein ONZ45_g8554 [Pleurotus djamor]
MVHAGRIEESKLPTELIAKIISHFDSDRSALRPLLLVSWTTYHLAVTALYESIAIALNLTRIPCLDIPTVVIDRSRVPQLLRTFETQEPPGRRLGDSTSTLLLLAGQHDSLLFNKTASALLRNVGSLLHHFVNLKQLYISSLRRHDIDLRQIIPPSICLTHLTILSADYDEIIGVLQSHPSLQVVCVKPLTSHQCKNKDALMLPHLTSFSGPMSMWDCLSPEISPIQFLNTQITRPPPLDHPLLPTITNLTVVFTYDMHTLAILYQLKRVQYLRISIGYMSGRIEEFIENVKRIPSSSFKYLAVTIQEQSTTESIHSASTSLFAAIPSLLVIDISEGTSSRGTPMLTRLGRQDMVLLPTEQVVDDALVGGLSRSWYGVDEDTELIMLMEIDDM